jgi:hypothetical protein
MAIKVLERGPPVTLREWRKLRLRGDYRRGAANDARDLPEEPADPAIVETGSRLRQQVLAAYERKYAAARYRVLMLQPSAITADIWFGDLSQCMRHAGIECELLPPNSSAAAINDAFAAFEPNVFIATEALESLRSLDLAYIKRYKQEHGCLRLFIPVWHAGAPRDNVPGARSTPQIDAWRRGLRAGGFIGDAHFSLFETEFHERFSRDPKGPDVEYLPLPMACNPFVNYPVAAAKRHDYIMVASMTDDRVEVSYRFLRPVIGRYRGLWAGPRWGFGTHGVPPADMSLHYARSRVALSPLVSFVRVYAAELTHRVYATAACGAFQLTVPTSITARYFRDDELVQCASPAEYARLFDHYVDRPLERNAIALAALRRAFGEHTCFHRIDDLVARCDEWRRKGLF